MEPEEFLFFLKDLILKTKIDLSLEPPQATLFQNKFVEVDGEMGEHLTLAYPHLCLADEPSEMWSFLVRLMMQETPSCDGVVFWCIVESPETNRDSLLFFIYKKYTDSLVCYLTNIFLTDVREVELGETLPAMVDDYGEEIIGH